MTDLKLEFGENILLQTNDAGLYNENNEIDIDELYLTNRNIIFVYEKPNGLFSKSETIVDRIPLSMIAIVNGIVQVQEVDDADYGKSLQFIYTDGKKELLELNISPKKQYPVWEFAIIDAVNRLAEPTNVVDVTKQTITKAKQTVVEDFSDNNAVLINFSNENEETYMEERKFIFCSNCGEKLDIGSRFCNICGTPIIITERKGEEVFVEPPIAAPVQELTTERKTVYEGELHKCPNCGEILDSFVVNCPSCNHEIRGVNNSTTVKEFAKKLEEIEKTRHTKRFGFKKLLENQTEVNETDLQKISLIRSFVIPNTKEDLLEFLVLASSNINLQRYNDFDSISTSEQAVSDAWEAKFEQAYEKAKLSFGNTTEFKKIQTIYDKKSGEIKKSKKKRTYYWIGFAALFICIGVLSFGGIFAMGNADDKKIEAENARLEEIVEEVYEALEDENYVLARAKAASLTFSGPDTTTAEKASEKWDITRTELLAIIDTAENGEEISVPNDETNKKDENQTNNTTSAKKPTTNTSSFDSASVIKQLKVTEHRMSDLGEYYTMLIIENPTKYNLTISAEAKFYNKSDKLVGAESNEIYAFEKGTKTIMIFSADEEYERMDYEFNVEEEDYYNCVISSLKYETVRATEKEILSVTNIGNVPAEFVEVSALFFKDGKLVNYDWTFFTDDDSEIKPNKTITKEIDCYEEYDAVEFYFTGHAEKE